MEALAVVPRTEPRSLVRKLAEVMAEVEHVQKRGRNDFHKYDYATEADINAAVRKGMATRNLILVPSVQKEEWMDMAKGGKLCTLSVLFRLMDGDSGEELAFTVLGQGQDAGDKATYKAMTGALKYALLKLFLIPTGDDPEADAAAHRQAFHRPPPQQARPRPPLEKQFSPEAVKLADAAAKPAPKPAAAPVAPARQLSETEAAMVAHFGAPMPTAAAPKEDRPAATPAQLRARATRVWNAMKAGGATADGFRAWAAETLGRDVKSTEWTEAEVARLEDEVQKASGG